MVRVSAAVMAHPSRKDWVEPLMLKLGLDSGQYVDAVFDQISDCWDTARRAWLAFDPEATHHLVVQDDAIASRHLIPGVAKALPFTPAESIMSLYIGTRRPVAHSVNKVVRLAERDNPSWIVMNGLNWGVAVVIPVPEIRAMVEWCDQQRIPGDDNRIRRYFVTQKKWPTWCPWPSLVDHRQIPSILSHRTGRRAHRFVGADVSALDVDFTRGHVTMDQASVIRTPIRRSPAMAENDAPKKAAKKTAKKTAAKKVATAKVDETTQEALQTETVLEEPQTEPQSLAPEPQPEHAPPAAEAVKLEPQADEPKQSGEVVELNVEDRPRFPKDNARRYRRVLSKRRLRREAR